ncbi:MAG: MBL fold metallo-hydrolase [Fimbriimonadaceae bacterium]|nr:MBL fold metallo-hydrolase [Fimbriimonadaceae bacterium]
MASTLIDTGLYGPGRTAAYLILQDSGATIFDTGARSSLPSILARLDEVGVEATDVSRIVLSHVHLDHAGGAGALMMACPNATLIVHPRGARHMIDPSKLDLSSRLVYGDEVFEEMFGSLMPVPAERVKTVEDGEEIGAFKFFDSPGHAYHHLVMLDQASGELFAGDAFGLAYPEFKFGLPSTSPTQFDPEAALTTYDKIIELAPTQILIAHFGPIRNIATQLDDVRNGIEQHVQIGQSLRDTNQIEQALLNNVPSDARDHFSLDCHMNALGLAHWAGQVELGPVK